MIKALHAAPSYPATQKSTRPTKLTAPLLGLALWLLLALLAGKAAVAQVGGQQGLAFLHLAGDARLGALGGANVSYADGDVALFFSNPAALQADMQGMVSLSHMIFYAGTGLSQAAYSRSLRNWGQLGLGIRHMGYGEFQGYDATGNATTTFRAGETSLEAGLGQTVGNLQTGVSAKLVGGHLSGYNTWAALLDIGVLYKHPVQDLNVGLVLNNVGWVWSPYRETSQLPTPLEIQLGVSFKPEYMPLRFSLTAQQLQRPRLYAGDDDDDMPRQPLITVADQVLRHLVAAAEFNLGKSLVLRAGYNHRMNRELRLATGSRGSGFSWGAGYKNKRFALAYANNRYHAAGSAHQISLQVDTRDWFVRKKEISGEL